jgi:hypothetical protein
MSETEKQEQPDLKDYLFKKRQKIAQQIIDEQRKVPVDWALIRQLGKLRNQIDHELVDLG